MSNLPDGCTQEQIDDYYFGNLKSQEALMAHYCEEICRTGDCNPLDDPLFDATKCEKAQKWAMEEN